MKINGFIWLEEIVDKLLYKHKVDQEEVRSLFNNRPHFRFVEKGHQKGENVYAALGQTRQGRYLIVFFVYKKSGQALTLSARDMTASERKSYEKR